MKHKKIFIIFLLSIMALSGCKNKNKESSSSSINYDSTSTTPAVGDEVYNPKPVEYEYSSLSCISQFADIVYNGEKITSEFILDPVRLKSNKDKNIISRCSIANMKDQVVIYSPNYFMRNSEPRDEQVTEYTIVKQDNKYIVSNISNETGNYIPLNGFVMSIPNSLNKGTLSLNNQVDVLGYTFDTYEMGIYTERGTRIAIDEINTARWGTHVTRAHLLDNRSDYKTLLGTGLMDVVKFNFNEQEGNYEIVEYDRRSYYNALDIPQDGFMLMNYVTSETTWIEENLVFQKDDKVFVDYVDIPYKNTIIHKIGNNDDNYTVSIYDNLGQPTGQNEWGYEIAISDNHVVNHGVNVNVPSTLNSYVIRFSNFKDAVENNIVKLRDEFKIGVEVIKNENNIIVNYDVEDFGKRYVNNLINGVKETVLKSEEELYDFDINRVKSLQEIINKIPYELDYTLNTLGCENNTTNQYHYINQLYYAKYLADQVILSGRENSPVETRSIWHYPETEDNLSAILETINTLKANNFNEVIVSSMLYGYANFKSEIVALSKIADTGKYGPYKDYLEAFVSEAHKAGLKVQVSVCNWFEYQGLVEKSPEYGNYYAINADGSLGVDNDGEITKFLDPTNVNVQNAFLAFYQEILDNYDVDGLHLDYIRYGAGNESYATSQGYTDSAAQGFVDYCYENDKTSYELVKKITTGNELNQICKNNNYIYNSFSNYRRQVVSDFVYKVKQKLTDGKQLSLAVVSNMEYAKNGKLQDWESWVKKGWINSLYLMAYYCDYHKVADDSIIALNAANNKSYVVTGISPVGMGLEIMEVFNQIAGARDVNVQGTAIFATHSFYRQDLSQYLNGKNNQGAYNTKAIVSYESIKNVINAYMTTLKDRAERIYLPSGKMNQNQYDDLLNDINIMLSVLKDNNDCLIDVINQLNIMAKKSYGDENVMNRINEMFSQIRTNLAIKESFMQ